MIYNCAASDVQERLQARVSELDFEVHEEESSTDASTSTKGWNTGKRSRHPTSSRAPVHERSDVQLFPCPLLHHAKLDQIAPRVDRNLHGHAGLVVVDHAQ